MNLTHLHLLLNHFPIIGTLIATALLIWAFIARKDGLKVTASIILIIMALIAIPVYFTGEPAEESVEHLVGVVESAIEAHEEAAVVSLTLLLLTGAVSAVVIVMRRTSLRFVRWDMSVVTLLACMSTAAMAYTGYLGGEIRHSEIRSGATAPTGEKEGAGPAGAEQSGEGEEKTAPSASTMSAGTTTASQQTTPNAPVSKEATKDATKDEDNDND